jgi:hypothetical protein
MKKMILVVLIACFCHSVHSQESGNIPTLDIGSKLTYKVNFRGMKYDFIIDLKQLEPRIIYDWRMTIADDKKGTVTMQPEAIATATKQYNYFDKDNINLTDATCVWVSKSVFASLKEGKPTVMNSGNQEKTFLKKALPAGTEPAAGNKKIDCIYAESEDGTEKYWIMNNPEFPLILKMDLGWQIAIDTIENL